MPHPHRPRLRLPPKPVKRLHPSMLLHAVQRRIIQHCRHLHRRTFSPSPANCQAPRVRRPRHQLRRQMLPLHHQFLVPPRHPHRNHLRHHPPLPHLTDPHIQSAPVRLGNPIPNPLLAPRRIGPKPLHHFPAMLNLHQRPHPIITRSPQRPQFLPRLQFPTRSPAPVRHPNPESLRPGIHHHHVRLRSHFLPEPVVPAIHHPVRPSP